MFPYAAIYYNACYRILTLHTIYLKDKTMADSWANLGLAVFVFVVNCSVAGLSGDLWLSAHGLPTVTAIAVKHKSLALAICVFNSLGVAGLAVHFFCRTGIR